MKEQQLGRCPAPSFPWRWRDGKDRHCLDHRPIDPALPEGQVVTGLPEPSRRGSDQTAEEARKARDLDPGRRPWASIELEGR
ncbi:hypothetical protein [Knoellia sp. p5-6-4]|uniref:hypothetical protein n=1 Tax=unclassified Knoellia TaxID=2618719 RepID=UPI0023DC8BC8|nr:hypothetical protein [Knoellia sp. p5-6-4]MDF2146354.1 hypothetical protein [Knoellia sp. p5-6-4]